MLAQRGGDLTRQAPKPQSPRIATRATGTFGLAEVPPPPAKQSAKQKMSFKDAYALETLPKTIAALQAEADKQKAKLDDPQFYARDRAAFEKVTAVLGEIHQKIAAAEEQWLELEILREKLANN
jgi:ABC transport system ATP-binding/permease protein